MSSDTVKPWQRPWSTGEIIENAPNWSLAGDAGLLKHLEFFSENLLSKAEETNNNLNKLLSGLDNASLALDEAKNDFRALRNTQFIESRVYEDDETVQQDAKTQEEEVHKPSKEEKVREVREAILGGIAVVERYFDKVEVPGSDSDDETDFTSFVLKPKDPYVDRPLPFVIGTDEWYKKWHVGLLDSSSESDDEKVSEKFSDSDSGSESSYNANKVNEMVTHERPVANSTFNESVKPPLDLFGDSDGESTDVTASYVSTAQRNFANELAAKLGNYVEEPEVNRKPINAVVNVKPYGNLFPDEPPPIVGDTEKGLFSGGAGLFDDLDGDAGLWNEAPLPKVEKSSYKDLFSDDNDLFSNTTPQAGNSTKNATSAVHSRGLFDDDDDDLFNESSSKVHPAPYLPPAKTTSIPYFADEPPELQPPPPAEPKKPFGGVKLIEQSDLDRLVRGRPSSSESSSDETKTSPPPLPKIDTPKKPKQLSLFDDDDEEDDERALFEKDLFSTITSFEDSLTKITEAPRSKLVDEGDDLFGTPAVNEAKHPISTESDSANIPPLSNVFDSNPSELDWETQSDNVFEDGGLFDNVQEISSQRSGLFDSEPPSLFFESSGIVRDISTRVGNDESFSPHATSSRRFSTDIFSDQQSNDSFFVTKNKSQFEPHLQSNLEIIPETSYTHDGDVSESNLEITPSGDIDSLYTEATASVADHLQSRDEQSIGESDSILSKLSDSPGKIKHNLKINVGALLPGASPLKKKSTIADESDLVQPAARLHTEPSAVLPSITKDRARISIKRRPSTRKGRQESLRNSVPDFSILSGDEPSKIAKVTPDETPKIPEPTAKIADGIPKIADERPKITDERPKIADEVPKIADGIPKIADEIPKIADEIPKFADDIPKIADEIPKIADPIVAIPHSDFVDIFEENARRASYDSPEKTDSNISVVKKITSVVEAAKEPKQTRLSSSNLESEEHKQFSLFDDDDDELGDIFTSNKLPSKSNIVKESLFDDDGLDDDDIFGLSFKKDAKRKGDVKPSSEKKVAKTAPVKKLENSKVVDDPLSSFLDI